MFSNTFDGGTAEQILENIAKSPRLIAAVKDALAKSDENVQKHVKGLSRSQLVRKAIAEAIQAD